MWPTEARSSASVKAAALGACDHHPGPPPKIYNLLTPLP
jgi:hypothetical protein